MTVWKPAVEFFLPCCWTACRLLIPSSELRPRRSVVVLKCTEEAESVRDGGASSVGDAGWAPIGEGAERNLGSEGERVSLTAAGG